MSPRSLPVSAADLSALLTSVEDPSARPIPAADLFAADSFAGDLFAVDLFAVDSFAVDSFAGALSPLLSP